MRRAAFVYKDQLSSFKMSETHVYKPSRLALTYELLDCYGAFSVPDSSVVQPQPATDSELRLFHTEDYIEAVRRYSKGEISGDPLVYGFSNEGDNPIFEGMYE